MEEQDLLRPISEQCSWCCFLWRKFCHPHKQILSWSTASSSKSTAEPVGPFCPRLAPCQAQWAVGFVQFDFQIITLQHHRQPWGSHSSWSMFQAGACRIPVWGLPHCCSQGCSVPFADVKLYFSGDKEIILSIQRMLCLPRRAEGWLQGTVRCSWVYSVPEGWWLPQVLAVVSLVHRVLHCLRNPRLSYPPSACPICQPPCPLSVICKGLCPTLTLSSDPPLPARRAKQENSPSLLL